MQLRSLRSRQWLHASSLLRRASLLRCPESSWHDRSPSSNLRSSTWASPFLLATCYFRPALLLPHVFHTTMLQRPAWSALSERDVDLVLLDLLHSAPAFRARLL